MHGFFFYELPVLKTMHNFIFTCSLCGINPLTKLRDMV